MTLFRKLLILFHRYLGMALCLLFVMWFVSGIAMIYVKGMPELTAATRLQHLPPLDFRQIQLKASEAAARAGIVEPPSRVLLLTIMGRPAWRFTTPEMKTVFADTGEIMAPVGPIEALAIASRFLNLPESALHHLRVIDEADQWTLGSRRLMPMHKISADDPARTELYVSGLSGEVSVVTTRRSRILAWVSAIPHWMYLEILRRDNSVWRRVVLWTSGLGVVLALMGIALAIIQYSRKPPHIRYAGWLRWHYITGAIFGFFTLTWVFSGFLSMEPWDWASSGGLGDGMREAFSGGPLDLTQFPAMLPGPWTSMFPYNEIKEVELLRIQGDAYYAVRGDRLDPQLVHVEPLRIRRELFSQESLVGKARQANPDVALREVAQLSNYDSYYYSRDGDAPLPVLRVKFDDPDQSWFYIDPVLGRIVARFQRRERLQRWIYHGLHSLDFSFWYYNRPLWDIGVIALCTGGALLGAIGVLISIRRLRRDLRRVF
jgi:uncharacterized iron-regulated membrane protein